MISDSLFHFDPTPKNMNVGTADQISTNVYDAGAAKRLFGGFSQRPPILAVTYRITAGTGTLSFRVQMIAAAAADLTTGTEETLADSGVITLDRDDTALAIGDTISLYFALRGQRAPKRYYGLFYTQGTADQDGEVTAVIVEAAQTNMPYFKAAVP
jgi:hypothetical protein